MLMPLQDGTSRMHCFSGHNSEGALSHIWLLAIGSGAVDVNTRNRRGLTALTLVSENGYKDVISHLLDQKDDKC